MIIKAAKYKSIRCFVNRGVLYKGAVDKLLTNLSLMILSFSGFVASSIASDSYCS